MTTNTLKTRLTLTTPFGHDLWADIAWMPQEVTGFDTAMEANGIRTFAFDSEDNPPAFIEWDNGLNLARIRTDITRFDSSFGFVVEFRRVRTRRDLTPGAYTILACSDELA